MCPHWGELLPVCLNKYLWGGFFCFVLPSLLFININILVLSLVSDGLNKFSRGSVPKLLLQCWARISLSYLSKFCARWRMCKNLCYTDFFFFLKQPYQCCQLSSAGQKGSKGFLRVSYLLISAKHLFCHPVLCAVVGCGGQTVGFTTVQVSLIFMKYSSCCRYFGCFLYFHVSKRKLKN